MITIYKYSILLKDNFEIEMPVGATVLSFQVQRSVPCIWVQVNTNMPLEKRRFALKGTGHNLDNITEEIEKYIGTIQLENGGLIFHLFELRDEGMPF